MKAARKIKVVRTVQATRFRSQYRQVAARAKGQSVVLIENRRQAPKYLVDKVFLDELLRDNASVRATLEILSDPELTQRLLSLGKNVEADVRYGRLKTYSMEEAFAKS